MAKHIAILGDSIFDNGPYIAGAPDVANHLARMLAGKAQVTKLALDGSTTADVLEQLASLPTDVTHLAVSAGGNDILHHVAMLDQAAATVGEVIGRLADAQEELAGSHAHTVARLAERGIPVAFCTIYDANYAALKGRLVATAMSIFNDVITRNVHANACDLLDLRLVCTKSTDFANPIEPSAEGGEKIASLISRWVLSVDCKSPNTRVFV